MSSSIFHRGPDASGVFTDIGISLSHRRLSVIDLSTSANQPMQDVDRDLIIVYNGEIYNFAEIKNELKSDYEFKTKSDTEVILAGYKKWGKDVVSRLNGIFALAIWDRRNQSLFCARDHMGVKPFYYSWDNSKFIFASELKAILEHDIKRKLNLKAFNEYLRILYVPEPDTMIEGINKLPPGSYLYLKDKNLEIKKYWSPKNVGKAWLYDEAKQAVHDTVSSAVVRQLVADVPVGIYLSGGIDSSAVLSAVSKAKKNVKTFSIGFDLDEDEEKDKFNRDFDLAGETAKYFGAEHHPLLITASDVAHTLEETISSIDDPISNPTAIPMIHLSHFAKRKVSVVLSGNGGDELFGGYDRYRLSVISDLSQKLPGIGLVSKFSDKIKKLQTHQGLDRLVLFEFEKDKNLKKIINTKYFSGVDEVKNHFRKYTGAALDGTDDLMLADISSWLPDQALTLGDKMSMRNSLEERVPLLDREVVDLALSLPRDYKVDAFNMKKVLKDAFRKDLPEILFREPKRGWFSPGAKWLRRKEILDLVKNVLRKDYHEGTNDLFDWGAVEKMLGDHVEKKQYNLTILWAILTFQIWARAYKIKL